MSISRRKASSIFNIILLASSIIFSPITYGQAGSASKKSEKSVGHLLVPSNKKLSRPLSVLPGKPVINETKDGAYIWLDETGNWHLDWAGKVGQTVWFRVTSQESIELVSYGGAKTSSKLDKYSRLIIQGKTESDKVEVIFNSNSQEIELYGRWNFKDIANNLYISKTKFNAPNRTINLRKKLSE